MNPSRLALYFGIIFKMGLSLSLTDLRDELDIKRKCKTIINLSMDSPHIAMIKK